ncbi:MAG: winged helix-turn-helix domain-containing protein, partial [Myxococcota bacterium]
MDPLAPVPLATGAIVDPTTGGIVRDGRVVDQLTARDVALLGFFAAHPGIDLTRERLGTEVLALAPARLSRAVDSAVFRLRAKIEADPARPVQLITVQNVGYRWIPNAASIGTNIPPARDEILGRDDVLDGVHRTLAAHPSCTIVGPPGIGKTSVALSYARSRSFTGGAVLVELAGHRSKDGAVAAVAKALDVPNTDGEAEAAIGWAIANRGDVLVLLDDCEAVGEALVPTLCAWRSRAPRARWLLTSRARLGDADEHVVAVDPL